MNNTYGHDNSNAADGLAVIPDRKVLEKMFYNTAWKIDKFDEHGKLMGTSEIKGNMLLNEGINLLTTLLAGGVGTALNSANSYIGVGDSSAAEAATQTGLQAASNKLYKAMNASFPTYGTNQQIVFQADFGPTEANYAWQEFTVANGNSDAALNLNRKVSNQGTKISGQTWRVTITITFS